MSKQIPSIIDIDDFEVGTIKEKGMLVRLVRRIFENEKSYDELTRKLNQEYKTSSNNSLRVRMSLFPEDVVNRWVRVMNDCYINFYNYTTPWADTGYRLLLVSNYNEFTKVIRGSIEEFKKVVAECAAEYDSLLGKAADGLGKAYNRDLYPTADEFSNHFEMTVKFTKIPDTDDIRISLPKEELTLIRDEMYERVKAEYLAGKIGTVAPKAEDKDEGDNVLDNLKDIM
jgi:hypothetical protein